MLGVSVIHQMPLAVAERFSDLIRTVEDIIEQATQPVLEGLRTWLEGQDAAAIDSWELPEIIDALDSDFTAAHQKNGSPSVHGALARLGGELPVGALLPAGFLV